MWCHILLAFSFSYHYPVSSWIICPSVECPPLVVRQVKTVPLSSRVTFITINVLLFEYLGHVTETSVTKRSEIGKWQLHFRDAASATYLGQWRKAFSCGSGKIFLLKKCQDITLLSESSHYISLKVFACKGSTSVRLHPVSEAYLISVI